MTRANGSNGSSSTALLRQILHFVIPITAAYALEGVATLVPIWAAAHGGSPDETEATFRVGAVGLGNTVVICIALVVKSGWGWGSRYLGLTGLRHERFSKGQRSFELLSNLDVFPGCDLFSAPPFH